MTYIPKPKRINETSFDDLADELISQKRKPVINLSHGDNAEAIPLPNDLEFYQKKGKELNDQWLR